MPADDQISIIVEPGSFEAVVLRRHGQTVQVQTSKPKSGGKTIWVPSRPPPPATALSVALAEAEIGQVLSSPVDELVGWEMTLDEPLPDRAGLDTTVIIVIHGTNLVDFDDERLAEQLQKAADAGADVVIRLGE